MGFYKTPVQKEKREALLRRLSVYTTVNRATEKTFTEILNTNFAFEPMSEDEFRYKFLTLTTDYMENKDISLAEFNQAFSTSLESFLINEVKDHVMSATSAPSN